MYLYLYLQSEYLYLYSYLYLYTRYLCHLWVLQLWLVSECERIGSQRHL